MLKGRRVNITLDEDTKQKLIRLSFACQENPTTLAGHILKLCLNNPNILNFVQSEYKIDEKFKITARLEEGKVIYD